MIPCQRRLFSIPDGVTYLNCAYTSPLFRTAEIAGQTAVAAKGMPWTITPQDFFTNTETVRQLFAQLVECMSDDVALIPAVSYGVALAAKNLPLMKGQSIVILEEQFPSHVYSWKRLADQKAASIKTVKRPLDNDWTSAAVQAIDDQTAVVAVPNCHWTDGTFVDLAKVAATCRAKGAALVVDATQSLGAMPFSVQEIQPDFLITTAHKWLLGPYSLGFCYVAPKWQNGIPLEENWLNRAGSEDFSKLVEYRDEYQPGARRFDMGEVSNFILTPIAVAALQQLLNWKVVRIAQTLQSMTGAIAERALELGFNVAEARNRAPHMLGLSTSNDIARQLSSHLAREKVFVSVRGNAIRISPHLYIDEEDLQRLFEVLQRFVS